MSKSKKIFGTDGVRGLANRYPIDSETALKLGQAAAIVFRNGDHKHRIVIGKDTRISGYFLETALVSGITSMGVDVELVGPLPTPGIAFITRSMRADAGIVISASHNSYSDNGIKFFDNLGYKLPDNVEKRIEDLVLGNLKGCERPTGENIGKAHRIDDAPGRYIQSLKDSFPRNLLLDGMRIVVDCAHGAGYKIAPAVFRELGAEVISLGSEPTGSNINLACGALHPEYMCNAVREYRADVGVALDGDADRIIMCDEKGEVVDGDVILALCAKRLKDKGKLETNTIVATVMSNLGLDEAMNREGISVVRTPVGDRHVIQSMREGNYQLGGEQSGHIIFLKYNTTGDGILGSLQVLSAMLEAEKPLSDLKKIFNAYPQIIVNVPVKKKEDFKKNPEISNAVGSCEKDLGKLGRLVLRYSGTENLARIMVEGKDDKKVSKWANDIAGVVESNLGKGCS